MSALLTKPKVYLSSDMGHPSWHRRAGCYKAYELWLWHGRDSFWADLDHGLLIEAFEREGRVKEVYFKDDTSRRFRWVGKQLTSEEGQALLARQIGFDCYPMFFMVRFEVWMARSLLRFFSLISRSFQR